MTLRSIGTFTAGALLASVITFTGMQSWQAGAAPGDDDTTFVPVAPCRLLDTRAGPFNVGIRIAPLGPGETFPTQVTGSNGECIGIPSDATAVAFNVTTVNATSRSYLTLFPADLATPPNASNLNWVAGQSPTPNKVDVKLSPDGKVKIYNRAGTVDVIADIVGYYTPSSLTEIQARLLALETNKAFAVSSPGAGQVSITTTRTPIVNVTVSAPTAGKVFVTASATAVENEAGHDVRCAVSTNPTPGANNFDDAIFEASGATVGSADGEGDAGGLSRNRTFNIAAGAVQTYYLSCASTVSSSQVWGGQIDAIFLPN